MPELNANIPPIECYVRGNFLRDQEDSHDKDNTSVRPTSCKPNNYIGDNITQWSGNQQRCELHHSLNCEEVRRD